MLLQFNFVLELLATGEKKNKKMNNKDMETSVLSQYSIIRTGFTLLPETETNKQTKYWKLFLRYQATKESDLKEMRNKVSPTIS